MPGLGGSEIDDDDLPDAVREAEAAVAALAENYTVWVREDLATARGALERSRESMPENAAAVREIFDVCHNVKGQGGSFGYDLMTSIGGSLCDFVRDGGDAPEATLQVIEAHIAALEFVVDRNIKGDGGDAGRELVAKLKTMAEGAP